MKRWFRKHVLDPFYQAPPRFAGGLILNVLGYHLVRIAAFKIIHALHKKINATDPVRAELAQQLDHEGIVVLPNFFPEETFQRILQASEAATFEWVNKRTPNMEQAVVTRETGPKPDPIFKEQFIDNSLINELVSVATKKPMCITPKVMVERTSYHPDDLGKPSTDTRSDLMHFDVSYPTMKAFLYLHDTDESNAAFIYVPRSHKMTWARLWMEYKMSIKIWFGNLIDVETPEIEPTFIDRHGLKKTSIVGKANTLFIVNTMGFHQRGVYQTPKERLLININYRDLDSVRFWKQRFALSKPM